MVHRSCYQGKPNMSQYNRINRIIKRNFSNKCLIKTKNTQHNSESSFQIWKGDTGAKEKR
jgi:hypothetical protein